MEVFCATEKSSRIPEVDGLRGIAIGLVLFYHYFSCSVQVAPRSLLAYLFVPSRLAWSGVDLFFVLSGFLIGGILLAAKTSTNYFPVFYTRRFFRIVPIYAVLLLAFIAARLAAGGSSRSSFAWTLSDGMPYWTYLLFIQNFFMATAGTFGCNWLAATWSLAVEEQFYLTLPSIVRFFSRRALWVFVFAGIAIAPVVRMTLFRTSPQGWLASYVLLFCRADGLLFGVACALLLRNPLWRRRISGSTHVFPGLLIVLAGIAVYLTKIGAGMTTFAMTSFGFTSLAALYACFLLFVCTARPLSLLASVVRWRVLRWLGSIAYGAYLFHQPVQGILFALIRKGPPRVDSGSSLLLAVFALGVTLCLAHVSWNYFEARLVKLSHRTKYEFAQLREGIVSEPVPAGAPR